MSDMIVRIHKNIVFKNIQLYLHHLSYTCGLFLIKVAYMKVHKLQGR